MLTSPAAATKLDAGKHVPAAHGAATAPAFRSTKVGAAVMENRSKACGSIWKPTLRCPMRACARRTVFCSEPSTNPRSTSVARARAAWSTSRARVASGMEKLTNTSRAGASLMVAAPGAGWPIAS